MLTNIYKKQETLLKENAYYQGQNLIYNFSKLSLRLKDGGLKNDELLIKA